MDSRVLVRPESDPNDGDILDHTMELPDDTDIESVIHLTDGIDTMVQDVDRSNSHTPVFTVYVNDQYFAALKSLWRVDA